MMKATGNQRGVALVGAVAIMILMSLFTTVAVNVQTFGNVQTDFTAHSLNAYAAAHGVAEWYMRQLDNDSDWTDNSDATYNLDSGVDVDITIDAQSANEITFTSAATVTPDDHNYDVTRSVTHTIERNSEATKFALFVEYAGARTRLRSNTQDSVVTGNIYSGGGGDVDTGNTVQNGIFYIPSNESFTADAGTYIGKQIPTAAEPTFPVLDPTNYQAAMDAFDALIATAVSNGPSNYTLNNNDMDINSHSRCTAGICEFGTLLTRGNTVNITGSGTIICTAQCRFHDRSAESEGSQLNIIPDDGGTITILSQDTLEFGHANGRTDISINTHATNTSTVNLYCPGNLATGDMVQIRGNGTMINNSANPNTTVNVYSRRRIQMNDGAQSSGTGNQNLFFIEDSFPYYGDSTNNRFQIIGDSNASVGRPTIVEGTLIVYNSRDPNDAITMSSGYSGGSNALFNGLMYQYDSTNSGEVDLDDADITGSVIAYRLQANQIRRTTITYDPSVLPEIWPDGFDNYVTRKLNSSDGL